MALGNDTHGILLIAHIIPSFLGGGWGDTCVLVLPFRRLSNLWKVVGDEEGLQRPSIRDLAHAGASHELGAERIDDGVGRTHVGHSEVMMSNGGEAVAAETLLFGAPLYLMCRVLIEAAPT